MQKTEMSNREIQDKTCAIDYNASHMKSDNLNCHLCAQVQPGFIKKIFWKINVLIVIYFLFCMFTFNFKQHGIMQKKNEIRNREIPNWENSGNQLPCRSYEIRQRKLSLYKCVPMVRPGFTPKLFWTEMSNVLTVIVVLFSMFWYVLCVSVQFLTENYG